LIELRPTSVESRRRIRTQGRCTTSPIADSSAPAAPYNGFMEQITLLLAAGERSLLRGLRMRLAIEPGLVIAGEARVEEAAVRADALAPDVVVVDVDTTDRTETAVQLVSQVADRHVVVVVSLDDRAATARALVAAGAAAFVQKHNGSTALITAIRSAAGRGREGDAMSR